MRGEVYMTKTGFARLNQERAAAGEETFANPRNSAAGTLKQLDPKIVAKRQLDLVVYGLGKFDESLNVTDHADLLKWLKHSGFKTPAKIWKCRSLDDLLNGLNELETLRQDFTYATDGAVIKLNSFALREQAGFTSKAPRWAIAYKYAAEQAETKLNAITIQVGRTGALTPVAELEPTLLAGTTVKRATLHNEDELRRKDIRVGDTVTIEKAGDVIPAVVGVVLTKRTGKETIFHFPTTCPECGAKVVKADADSENAGVVWRCPNLECPAQVRGRIEHWCARGAMDIEGGGEVLAAQLVKAGTRRGCRRSLFADAAPTQRTRAHGRKVRAKFSRWRCRQQSSRSVAAAFWLGNFFTSARGWRKLWEKPLPPSIKFSRRPRNNCRVLKTSAR